MAITQPGTVTPITNNAFPTPTVINTSAVQAPTAQSVYSADNINQAVTNPVQAPVSAEQQLYNQFLATPEIAGAKKQVSDIQAQINAANQAFRNAKTGFEYQNEGAMGTTGASANLIGRQIGRASDLTANQVAALSENLKAQQAYLQGLTSEAQDRYNIAQNERSQIQSLITATKGKANITYTDSYEDALKKAAKYEEKVLKEERKQAEKDELKSTAKKLGIKTSGLSRKELEKKINKYYKKEQAKQDEMDALDLAIKRKSLTGGGTAGERTGAVLATAQSALLSSRGNDGKVNPGVYTTQRASYMRSGGTASDFDAQFGGLLSGSEQNNLGISTAQSKATVEQEQTKQKAQQTASSALNIVQRLKDSGSALGNTVGPISSKLPTIRGGSADFEQNYNALKSLLTLENMGVMKGVLSDSDIKIIQNASANLSLGQSESGFRKELDNIQAILQNRMGTNNSTNDPLGLGF